MFTYRNKKTGKVVTVQTKVGGDWELVSQSKPTEEKVTKEPEVKEKKKATPKKK